MSTPASLLLPTIQGLAERLGAVLLEQELMMGTAESCTGGLLAGAITSVAGSSDWFERGYVTYSNEAKSQELDVSEDVLAHYGAVSEPVARAMAVGALDRSRAALSIAVTGVAGPGGGSAAKPVGLVWFGLAQRGRETHSEHVVFPGDRTAVRAATVAHGFAMLRGRV